jgi:tetratricopeptide (TPR) repeat protein
MKLQGSLLYLLFVVLVAVAAPAFAQEAKSLAEMIEQVKFKRTAKEWKDALTLYEKILALNPHVAQTWFDYGHTLYDAEDYRQAIPAFEKALALGAGYPFESAYNIACCYALLGEKAKAMEWLDKSMKMGFRDLNAVRKDEDLKSLHDDLRFIELAFTADASKMSRDEGWRYDLKLLAREIKRLHYDPFRQFTQAQFDAHVNRLNEEIPKLSEAQIVVGLMKLARMAGDGHTSVFGALPTTKRLPVQLFLFTEGIFVTAAAPEHAELLGAQIIKVGEHPVEKVMQALDPLISRDNDMGPKNIAPGLMRNLLLLNGAGLIPDQEKCAFTIRDATGQTRTVTLPANAAIQPADNWVTVTQKLTAPAPLYLKNRRLAYWFEYLPESKTIFMQYNAVRNSPEESFTGFCERLFKFINENAVEKLIVDLRWNGGGNTFLARPLVHGLIGNAKINQRGKLFVITGRNTFSAAMNTSTMIERNTQAIFVGEPTGSSPNFIGETIAVELPYSKLRASVSDLYWQTSWPMDHRTWIAPLLYAPPSFELNKQGRDPALEAIFRQRGDW